VKTAAITVAGLIFGCSLVFSGCFPQPSARELYQRTHFNYSVVQVDEAQELGDAAEDGDGRAESQHRRPILVDQQGSADPSTIDAVFEHNADVIRYCIKGVGAR
jgi:hypothetical protein